MGRWFCFHRLPGTPAPFSRVGEPALRKLLNWGLRSPPRPSLEMWSKHSWNLGNKTSSGTSSGCTTLKPGKARCFDLYFFLPSRWSWRNGWRKGAGAIGEDSNMFCLKMRKNFFPLRVTEPWPRLPREAVESPSLEMFKTRLDTVLWSLLWVTLLGQGVGLGDPQRSLPTPTIL